MNKQKDMKSNIKKEELIELLSERLSNHIYLENLMKRKAELEQTLHEMDDEDEFDEEDFFFSDAEDAARMDIEDDGGEEMPNLGDFEDTKSFVRGLKGASNKEAEKHAKGWTNKFSKHHDPAYSDYMMDKEIAGLMTKGNPSLNESRLKALRDKRKEIVESLRKFHMLNEAWEWGYSPEGYDNIRNNLYALDKSELVEIMKEWEVYEKVGENSSVKDFESVDVSKYEKLAHDTLADAIYTKAEEFNTAENGGHKAWVCPYGCHTVGLHSTFEYYINLDERGEFYADVRNQHGSTVFEIRGNEIFEDGFMNDKHDLDGLKGHLVNMKIMHDSDKLVAGN